MSNAFDQDLSACVTHRKKGDPEEVGATLRSFVVDIDMM